MQVAKMPKNPKNGQEFLSFVAEKSASANL
jgi:hypothetical protein